MREAIVRGREDYAEEKPLPVPVFYDTSPEFEAALEAYCAEHTANLRRRSSTSVAVWNKHTATKKYACEYTRIMLLSNFSVCACFMLLSNFTMPRVWIL